MRSTRELVKERFGPTFKAWREHKGQRLEYFAQSLRPPMQPSRLRQIEAGQALPSMRTRHRLAEALNVREDYLELGVRPPAPNSSCDQTPPLYSRRSKHTAL